MFRLDGQEPFLALKAETGAGSGGSTEGTGAGTPAGGGDAGSGDKIGGEGAAPDGQRQKADDGGSGDARSTAKTFDESYVKELRAEAAKHRSEKAAIEARLKAFEDAQLSESEKRDKRLAELEAENARLAGENRKALIIAEATAAGAIVPKAVVGLIPADAEDVKAAVAVLKRDAEYADLFRRPTAGSADAGAAAGGEKQTAPVDFDTWLRRAAGRRI